MPVTHRLSKACPAVPRAQGTGAMLLSHNVVYHLVDEVKALVAGAPRCAPPWNAEMSLTTYNCV